MNHSAAERLIDKGYTVVPLRPGSKAACTDYRNRDPPEELLRRIREEKLNIGNLLTGESLTVIDIDGESGREWADENGLRSPMVAISSKGEHRYFRGRAVETNIVKYRDLKVDILVNGYTVAPSSVIAKTEWRYTWKRGITDKELLPLIPEGIVVPERKFQPVPVITEETRDSIGGICCLEKYCLRIPSVEGSFGSKGLVRVVKLWRDQGRTRQQTFDYIKHVWGPLCAKPEWPDDQIWRAINRHYQEPVR